MDIIELSREIGRQLQKDEKYIALGIAKQTSDEDEVLQKLIGDFNLKRLAINNEASKPDRSDEKLQSLNKELREIYSQIIQNENMIAYNNAKNEFDTLVQRVLAIISQSAEGDDPETTDYSPSCTGSCSTCSGCH